MIDFVTIHAYDLDKNKLLNNDKFDFNIIINKKTGDVKTYFATHSDISIIINRDRKYITFKGSLHKYYHGNNYSQFTFSDFIHCIKKLKNEFGILSDNARIKRFEFGVNIYPSITPNSITERTIAYKRERFCQMQKGRIGGILGIYCDLDRFKIKIYDKGKHYSLKQNVLRFEIVVKKMVQMHKVWSINVHTLQDLCSRSIWQKLLFILLETYDHILIDEISNEEILNIKERRLYLRYRNSDGFKRAQRNLHRNTFGNQVNRFKKLQSGVGTGLKRIIRLLIEKTVNHLRIKNGADAPLNNNNQTDHNEEIYSANAQLDNIVHLHQNRLKHSEFSTLTLK